jgi:membrane peptidoglycan carboxypeptidase
MSQRDVPGPYRRGWRGRLLHGSWWRRWTWRKALKVGGGAIAALCLLVMAGVIIEYERTPVPAGVFEAARVQSSEVYFSNGRLAGTFSSGVNRQVLTSAQIPAVLKQAVIAAEDRHFYTEGGISVPGIARAAYEDVFGHGGLQGGSTITEQLAKNYYTSIGPARTIGVKVREIFVAARLARQESKNWILTQYLNTVYLGDDCDGVGAAAEAYFGEPASRLDVAQAAVLAAMLNQPGYFSLNPRSGPAYRAIVARWHYVLKNMARDGAISRQEAAAQQFPKAAAGSVSTSWNGYRGYLMQMTEQELESTYGISPQQIATGGLRITTTFSQPLMNALHRVVPRNGDREKADGRPRLPSYAHIGAVVERPETGAIAAVYGGPGYGVRHCARLSCEYNLAEAPNEAGSSIEPYVLAALARQEPGAPDGGRKKNEAMLSALAQKRAGLLAPAAQAISAQSGLVREAAARNVIRTARRLGVGQDPFTLGENDLHALNALLGPHGRSPRSATVDLGQADLTAVEQAAALATLADDGVYHAPHVIAALDWGTRAIPLRVARHQVLSLSQAAVVDDALSAGGLPAGGSAGQRPTQVFPAIAVAGTLGTGAVPEAWYTAAVPQSSMSVGLFLSKPPEHPDGPGGTAAALAVPWPQTIWKALISAQLPGLLADQVLGPDGTGRPRRITARPRPLVAAAHPADR